MVKKRTRSVIKLPPGWKAEALTPRMKKPCDTCGAAPKIVRIVHTIDGYPFPTTQCLCATCALGAMNTENRAVAQRISEFKAHAINEEWM